MDELVQYARGLKNQYPHLFNEIWSLITLCQDEIEEGGSEEHEIQLCRSDIEELINERG